MSSLSTTVPSVHAVSKSNVQHRSRHMVKHAAALLALGAFSLLFASPAEARWRRCCGYNSCCNTASFSCCQNSTPCCAPAQSCCPATCDNSCTCSSTLACCATPACCTSTCGTCGNSCSQCGCDTGYSYGCTTVAWQGNGTVRLVTRNSSPSIRTAMVAR